MRCRDYFICRDFNPHWEHPQENLTSAEIESSQKGNFSFIGAEKRIQESWEAELTRRHNIAIEHSRGPRIEWLTKPLQELCFDLNMRNRPKAPEYDYLRCWHEQWNSKNNPNIMPSLSNRKCRFYYPISDKGEKSFDGCYREQQDKKIGTTTVIGLWTLVATILGIAVAFILHFL